LFNASHMKVIRVSAHVGGPGSRRYDRCTDPLAAERRQELGLELRERVCPKTGKYGPKRWFGPFGAEQPTLLSPVAIGDGGFIPLLDFSRVKASVFT
ncbi:unnamed protein product, partial [Tetraodon nigroviridis]